MAELLWGQVYYQRAYAGILRQEPGDRASFIYDASYLSAHQPPIAWTLPPAGTTPHLPAGTASLLR